MTGLRGRASIAGGALIMMAGLAVPAATATSATAAATAPVSGVDVSASTDVTSWTQLAAGNSFVGIKATEGDYYENKYYAQDVAQATKAGLYVMPYVFANPYPGNGTAVGQADYAWDKEISKATPAYKSSDLMLPLVLDIEADPYVNSEKNSNQCYGLSPSAMVTWIQQFLTEAKRDTGKTPIIYTAPDWWSACTGNSTSFAGAGYPLWLASYGVPNPSLPSGWNNYTFWQYTSGGTVAGIKGGTDLDYLGPVLQVSQADQAIAPVQLQTLSGLSSQESASYSVAGLPPGVTWTSSGQISGTPETADIAQQYTVTVTPSAGSVPKLMTFTWIVHGALTVNSPGNRTATAGTPVFYRVTAADQDGPQYPPSFAGYGLPTGLSMNSSGLITGWPSKPGTFKVTVYAFDGLYASGSVTFTWTIKAAADSGFAGAIRQVGGSGKCLTDPGSATANGTTVNLWSCDGQSNQRWTVVPDGTIRVLGKCLDVVGEAAASGAKLQLSSCSSGDGAQQWQAGTDGELVNPQSGKCLYVPVAKAANGTQPVLWPCANVPTQSDEHWLRPAASVYSGYPGKCLAAAGSTVELASCANTGSQHWSEPFDGTVRLGSKCLTETAATTGSRLSVGSCSGAAAAKWQLASAGPIGAELVNTASGLCVTAPSGANGVHLVIEACAATPAATWHVE